MTASPRLVRAAACAARLLRDRWLVRAPAWAYRARLGAVFGSRLVMLEHTGRVSGRRRFAVLKVAGHPAPGTYVVVSGFGGRAEWFRNIQADPRVRLYIGSRGPAPAAARLLSREEAGAALGAYAAAHPRAWAWLKPALEHALGAEAGDLPMVALDLTCGAAAAQAAEPAAGRRPLDRARPWLAVAGVAVVLAALLPPAGDYARRYAFVEAIQFVVFALVNPALLVLGWPARRTGPLGGLPGRRGLPAWRRRPWTAGGGGTATWPVARFAALRLLAFVAAVIWWRLPAALDALARYPVLTLAEMVTLAVAGGGIWVELTGTLASRPPLPRPVRAAMAAVAMWTVWVIAYITGMSAAATVSPLRGGAVVSAVSAAADQQLAVAVMWAVPAICFVPVVYALMLTWLSAREDDAQEAARLTSSRPPAVPGVPRAPRGWRSPSPGRPAAPLPGPVTSQPRSAKDWQPRPRDLG